MHVEIGYKYHNCQRPLNEGIEIIYTDFNEEDQKNWWFHIYREATQKDVNDMEADEVGEILFSSAIVISFCPFCGEELERS